MVGIWCVQDAGPRLFEDCQGLRVGLHEQITEVWSQQKCMQDRASGFTV